MLEMRNVLQTKLNKKGFTLAELLVVVAIIAILVAVSIPIFTGKLNEARENTDQANARAAKAAAVTAYLQKDETQNAKYEAYYDAENGKMVDNKADIAKGYNKAKQKANGGTEIATGAGVVKVTIDVKAVGSSSEKVADSVKAEWETK